MRILAINCGSSSIKSALIDSASGARLLDVRVTAEAASALLDEVGKSAFVGQSPSTRSCTGSFTAGSDFGLRRSSTRG